MAIATNYRAGTVSVSAGGITVTGVGTSWLVGGIREGDIFSANGLTASVASVNSATSITLARPWPGAALAGAAYEIRYTPDAARVLASSREALIQMETLRDTVFANAYVYNNVTDGLAATTNGQQFLVNDNGILKRYRRDSATSATLRVSYPSVDALNNAIEALNQAAANAAAAIAAEVKTNADNAVAAAAAAVTASNQFRALRQDSGSLPVRPPGVLIVHWYTWDDPSDAGAKLMQPGDVWFKLPTPTLPEGITKARFKLVDQLNGTLKITLSGIPDYYPALTGIGYRIDGETAWTPAGITGNGEFITRVIAPGAHTIELAAQNFLGYSTANQIYPFSILNDGTMAKQSFAGYSGPLTNLDNWVASSTPFNVTSGKARNDERDTTKWNYLAIPVGPSFFVEADLNMIASSTRVDLRIGTTALYLRLSPSGAWAIVNAAGTSLLSGTIGTGPKKARIDLTPTSAKATVNDTVVGEVAHTINYSANKPGIGWWNNKQDTTWNAILADTYYTAIRAGNL